jgi:Zn-dependent protease
VSTECPVCSRPDFASGLRCQWCGAHFAGVPAFANTSIVLDENAPAEEAVVTESSEGTLAESPKNGWQALLKKTWGWLLALFALSGKLKGLLVLFKFGKFFTTALSMLVSIGVYAIFFGWKFAVGLVLLIFVHEIGHVLIIRYKGLPASAPIFIPLLGAAIFLKKRPEDPLTDAQISYGGPLLGTVGAIGCYLVYLSNSHPLWLVLAHVGFFLNLFNLVPATPLDGGWIVKAISPKLWLGGAVLGLVAGFFIHSVLLVIIAAFSIINAWKTLHDKNDDPEDEYDEDEIPAPRIAPMSTRARLVVTFCYLGLAAFLGGSLSHTTHALHEMRQNHTFERQAPATTFQDRIP